MAAAAAAALRRTKQSRRVSWAPDLLLHQVRLFLSEDAPALSRLVAQDHLQPRSSFLQHSTGIGSDDSLPPGFDSPHSKCMISIPQIPLIKWQCPAKLSLHPQWEVVAGEESKEVVLEEQRLQGVLEAIYPRPSSIPPNPVVSSEVAITFYDDSCTPSIPIIPIEDEATPEQPKSGATVLTPLNFISPEQGVLEAMYPRLSYIPPNPIVSSEGAITFYDDSCTPNIPIIPIKDEETPEQPKSAATILSPLNFISPELLNSTPSEGQFEAQPAIEFVSRHQNNVVPTSMCGLVHDEKTQTGTALDEPDVLAAASAAFTAIMRSNEEGSMIDQDLLINILNNPSLLEKLLSGFGTSEERQIVANPHPSSTTALPPPVSYINHSATQLPQTAAPIVYPAPTSVPSVNPTATLVPSSVNSAPSNVVKPASERLFFPIDWHCAVNPSSKLPQTAAPIVYPSRSSVPATVNPTATFVPSSVNSPPISVVKPDLEPLVSPMVPHCAVNPSSELPQTAAPIVYPSRTSVPLSVNPTAASVPSSLNSRTSMVVKPDLERLVSPIVWHSAVNPSSNSHVLKDRNYYKSLVQRHGGERPGDPSELHYNQYSSQIGNVVGENYLEGLHGSVAQRDQDPRFAKPCSYFNTPKGCKRGASCFFQHDRLISQQVNQQQSSKRIKLDRVIAGRT